MEEEKVPPVNLRRQVLKSILGGLLGACVGVVAWFIFDANTPTFIPILIGALAVAAGVGLTLPGVSARRVAKGVAVGIVAKPLPRSLRDQMIGAVFREEEERPPQSPEAGPVPPKLGTDDFASYLRRVKLFAVVAGVIGGALGLCFSVLSLMKLDHPDIRGVVVAPVMCGLIFGAMVAGCALLFAPLSFFNSEKGKACLKTIGATDVAVARGFIFVCLLLGCGIITLLVLGALQMTGVIDPPLRQ